MQYVNPSFNIQASTANFTSAQLFIEAGPMGLSFVVLDEANCFNTVKTYSFPTNLSEAGLTETISHILQNEAILQHHFVKTHIYWSFPQSVIVPNELLQTDKNTNSLNLVYGNSNTALLKTDFLYKQNLHNIYRSTGPLQQTIDNIFTFTNQTHLYSALANKTFEDGNHLYTVFYSNALIVLLCKAGQLQMIQNFSFSSPEDAAYHLLQVCKGFDLKPDDVNLHISGLIDKKSGLFEGIYKYFLNIQFDGLPEQFDYCAEIKEHPTHFFSHLFSLAACV